MNWKLALLARCLMWIIPGMIMLCSMVGAMGVYAYPILMNTLFLN